MNHVENKVINVMKFFWYIIRCGWSLYKPSKFNIQNYIFN